MMEHAKYLKLTRMFWRGLSKDILEAPGLFAVATGLSSAYLNPVLEISNLKQLQQIKDFYAKHNLKWSMYLDIEALDQAFLWDLQGQGLEKLDSAILMTYDLIDFSPDKLSKELRSVCVKTEEGWDDWIKPIQSGFGTKDQSEISFKHINQVLSERDDIDYECFLLYSKDKPAASGSVTCFEDSCRLDNMATEVAFQHQGLGTYLTHVLMAYAKNQGGQYCVLESTQAAFEFYKGLGFEYFAKMEIYGFDTEEKKPF